MRVEGKSTSFEYVAHMKEELNKVLEAQVALPKSGLKCARRNTTLMGNKSISVIDDLSGQGSVFNVIDSSAVDGYCVHFREPESAQDEAVHCQIRKIINSRTKLLMVLICISPGLALPFTELSTLNFSGFHRNSYSASNDGVFIIRSR